MYSVLLVDDEPNILEVLSLTIPWEAYGFSVDATSSNALDALDVMKRYRFDLIVTDIHLPIMDGLEFIRNVRAVDSYAEIIIISGYNRFEYAKQAIKLRVDSYILKPIDPSEVCEQLQQVKSRLKEKTPLADAQRYGDIAKIIYYVNEHFDSHISLKSISEKFFINTSYLGQKFKAVTGDSFNDYINKKRIDYVKRNCKSRQGRMNEIISAAGFRNQQYFYKQYRRFEGISFSEYVATLKTN